MTKIPDSRPVQPPLTSLSAPSILQEPLVMPPTSVTPSRASLGPPSILVEMQDKTQVVADEVLSRTQTKPPMHMSLKKIQAKVAKVDEKIQKHTLDDPIQGYLSVVEKIGPDFYPDLRLDIILKIADHLLKNGQLKHAALAYNAAYQFAIEQLPSKTGEVSKNLLKPIQSYLNHIDRTVALEPSWQQHRMRLATLRDRCQSALISTSVREVQREISKGFTELIQEIVNCCVTLLGPPPCKFCFISLGSLSREEICPYSDIECGILFEKTSSYFQHLAKLFELHLINMGETNHKLGTAEKGGVEIKAGFSLDIGGMTPEYFQNTPQAMAMMQKAGGGDSIHNNALREASFMFGADELFLAYKQKLNEILSEEVPRYRKSQDPKQGQTILRRRKIALKLLADHFKNDEFKDQSIRMLGNQLINQSFSISLEALQATPDPSSYLNVKKNLCRFIPMSLGAMALFQDLPETNSFDRIIKLKEQGVLSSFWANKLLEWLKLAFRLRFETHLHYRCEKEKLSLVVDPRWPKDKMLSMHERQRLSILCNTVVLPFRAYIYDWLQESDKEPTLPCRSFFDNKPLLNPLIALGKQWLNEGSLEKAKEALEEALSYVEKERYHEITLLQGHVYRQMGDWLLANHYYDLAVKAHASVLPMVEHFKKEVDQKSYEQKELLTAAGFGAFHNFLRNHMNQFEQLLVQLNSLNLHANGLEKRLLDLEQSTETQLVKSKTSSVDKITLLEKLKSQGECNHLHLRVICLSQLSELMKLTPHIQLQEALLKTQQSVMDMPITAKNADSLCLSSLMHLASTFVFQKKSKLINPHGTNARDFLMSPLLVWIAQLFQASKKTPKEAHGVFKMVFNKVPDELKVYFLNSLQRLGKGSHLCFLELLDRPLETGFRLGALAQDFQWHQLLYHADMGYPDRIGNAAEKVAALLPPLRKTLSQSQKKTALLSSIEGFLPLLANPQELFSSLKNSALPFDQTDGIGKELKKTKKAFSKKEAISAEPMERWVSQITAHIQRVKSLVTEYAALDPKPSGLEMRLLNHLEFIAQEYQKFLVFFNSKGDEEKAHLLQPQVLLSGANTGRLLMHEEWGRALLQLATSKKEESQFGRHNVLKRGPFHFKVNPELPGIEYAVWALNQLVTGQGSPPHDLLRLQHGSEHHVILLSKTVPGVTLLELLTHTPEKLKLLDIEQFSQMILMALLTNPEDGKADNYIVNEIKDSNGKVTKIQIVGIDNDHAFVPPLKTPKTFLPGQPKEKALVKMILYCFDQMKMAIDPSVRRNFLNLNGAELLKRWLLDLQNQNRRYEEQFGSDEIQEYFRRDAEFAVVIPIYLKKGLVSEIFSKIQRLQESLRMHPTMTHLDLLLHIHPSLGKIYQEALRDYPTPLTRFQAITQGEYQMAKGSSVMVTMTKSKQMLIAMTGVNPQFLEEMQNLGFTPDQSLKELREIVLQTAGLENIKRNLIEGDGKLFEVVAVPDLIEKILEQIDFQKLTNSQQLQVLQRIQGKSLTKLFLRNCKMLSDAILKKLLKSSPHLTVLDLRNCVGLEDASAIAFCPHLTYINLSYSGLYTFGKDKKKLIFPHLRRLILNNCSQLASIHLHAEQIKELSLQGSKTLNYIQIEGVEAVEKLHLGGVKQDIIDLLLANFKERAEFEFHSDMLMDFDYFEKWISKFSKASFKGRGIVCNTIPANPLLLKVIQKVQNLTTVIGIPEGSEMERLLRKEFPFLEVTAAFGKTCWEAFFGDIGTEPPLPANIREILNSPCPFWPNKKVYETHVLTLIPQYLNGRYLTIDRLGTLLEETKLKFIYGGLDKFTQLIDTVTDSEIEAGMKKLERERGESAPSHWVLMTREVIKKSPQQSFQDLEEFIAKAGQGYVVPTLRDATFCLLMAYFVNGEKKMKAQTRCEEKIGITPCAAMISNGALVLGIDMFGAMGIAPLKKF